MKFYEKYQRPPLAVGKETLLHREIEERLRFCTTLPTLSAVALRVIELAGNPIIDLGEVAGCINLDPALAAKVLRVANSPFYAKRRRTGNLRQALTLLGLDTTVTLALSFSLTSSLRGRRQTQLDTGLYWRRSILSAVAARALGGRLGLERLEDLFLGGLLQDIGMLVLDAVMANEYGAAVAFQSDHSRLAQVERETLGTDHLEVGNWMLGRWHLPEYLGAWLAASHGGEGPLPVPAACVAVSGLLADCWLVPDGQDRGRRAAESAERLLGLTGNDYATVLDTIAQSLPEVSALFEIEVTDPAQIAWVLESAKELLTLRNLQLLSDVATTKRSADAFESRTRVLEARVATDSLTSLYSRGWLDENLEKEFAYSTDQEWPLSVAFVDLDHFKAINDTHGHQIGDAVLKQLAAVLADNVRRGDFIARYGGEEFVVMLPGTGLSAARGVLQRMLEAVRACTVTPSPDLKIAVTASVGLAVHLDSGFRFESAAQLLRAADRAVYDAKRAGRDCLVLYTDNA